MIFIASDIHGCYRELYREIDQFANFETITQADKTDKAVFLGDYIDGGPQSRKAAELVQMLQLMSPGRVVALKGNHEQMFLDWIDTYKGPFSRDKYGLEPFNEWLAADRGFGTLHSFLSEKQWEEFKSMKKDIRDFELNHAAVNMILEENGELIQWMRNLPLFYETEKQIFAHAGIDEEAGEWWKLGTPEETFLAKNPITFGKFYKDIISGHIGTAALSHVRNFHDILWDGDNHYFCDGTVLKTRSLPVLIYDEETDKYYSYDGDEEPPTDIGRPRRIRGKMNPVRSMKSVRLAGGDVYD